MKRLFALTLLAVSFLFYFVAKPVFALPNVENEIGPISCQGVCPPSLQGTIYGRTEGTVRIPADDYAAELCTADYEIFLTDPARYHYWAEDIEVTNQGKANERARQFIYWVINSEKIEHPVLGQVWNTTRNIAYFLVVIVTIAIGAGYIVSQRTNYNLKIQVWPAIWKVAFALLYITFSFALITFLIDISEILMKFFIDQLGGRDLFNIYFTPNQSSEFNYTSFYGCRDMNIRSQEAAEAELTMLRITNVTYYVMGTMILLRKILLWFLLFVSPFLAILMPFVFIRNTGFIWIGVFFQWLFYGPLFALFLGGLSRIWKAGIPLKFDFSRTGKAEGYVYPTAIRILYGGPAQRLEVLNNANYIDTFVEYVITLIMLWAVTFFPWWLLRIFRDYCCDVFAAANNVLMQMYDQMRMPPSGPPPIAPQPVAPTPAGLTQQLPADKRDSRPSSTGTMVVRLENMQEIRNMKTADLVNNLSLSAGRLTDIARFETNKQQRETTEKTLQYLSNPAKAETPRERQAYMNLRTELFSRSVKQDSKAREILKSTSTSVIERREKQREILKTTTQAVPMSQVISKTTNVTEKTVQSVTNSIANAISNNKEVVTNIANSSKVSSEQVKSILNSYAQSQSSNQSLSQIISNIAEANELSTETVKEVLQKSMRISSSTSAVERTAEREHISRERVQEILRTIPQRITEVVAGGAGIPKVTAETKKVITSVLSTLTQDSQTMTEMQKETGLTNSQLKNVVSTYVSNIDQPAEVISQRIHESAGIEKKQVSSVLERVMKKASDTTYVPPAVLAEVAKKEGISQEAVKKIVDAQVPAVATPEAQVEESVPLPPSVSLEDYEEVKKMWTEQYEKGEVPVSGTIANRSEWVDQDVVTITNTLNKLLSSDETLRMEGLDDLGYILPIFMINNMSGDEIMVYLKAKLEAAKAIRTQLEKEVVAEVTQEAEEELVDIALPKKQVKPKVLHMALENEEESRSRRGDTYDDYRTSETTGGGIGEGIRAAARKAQTHAFILNPQEITSSSTGEILAKLDLIAEKLTDIARLETDTATKNTLQQHLEYLKKPEDAKTAPERQTYEQVRTELAERAKKQDAAAQQLITPSSEKLLSTMPRAAAPLQATAGSVALSPEKTKTLTRGILHTITSQEPLSAAIARRAQAEPETLISIYDSLVESIDKPASEVVHLISSAVHTTDERVVKVLQETLSVIRSSQIVDRISVETSLPPHTVERILTTVPSVVSGASELSDSDADTVSVFVSLFTNAAHSGQSLSTIATLSGFDKDTVRKALSAFAAGMKQNPKNAIDSAAKAVGMPVQQLKPVLQHAAQVVGTDIVGMRGVLSTVSQAEQVSSDQLLRVINGQIPAVIAPLEHVEQTVVIPQSVSLEDYEEVKRMWRDQYQKGEVPIIEGVANRTEWITKEIQLITNTLNKLLSSEEEIRKEGLEDLGYILPVFTVNNLSGDEIMVYLKAKLEAAKAVREEAEQKITEQSDADDEEEFVDIPRKKEEKKPAVMELAQEEELHDDTNEEEIDNASNESSEDNPEQAEENQDDSASNMEPEDASHSEEPEDTVDVEVLAGKPSPEVEEKAESLAKEL